MGSIGEVRVVAESGCGWQWWDGMEVENAVIGRKCGSGFMISLDGIPPWEANVGGWR